MDQTPASELPKQLRLIDKPQFKRDPAAVFLRETLENFEVEKQALLKANQELTLLTTIDELTQIPNRLALKQAAGAAFSLAQRKGEGMAILTFDLDHFKSVNDRFGHKVGDNVLQAGGAVIAEGHRQYDVAGRKGGEEFEVVLSSLNSVEEAVQVAERTRRNVEATRVRIPGHGDFGFTVSIGVAYFDPATMKDIHDVETLVMRSDEALYEAKGPRENNDPACRNRVAVYEGQDQFRIIERGAPLPVKQTIDPAKAVMAKPVPQMRLF